VQKSIGNAVRTSKTHLRRCAAVYRSAQINLWLGGSTGGKLTAHPRRLHVSSRPLRSLKAAFPITAR